MFLNIKVNPLKRLFFYLSLSLSLSLSVCVCLNKTSFVALYNEDFCMMSILVFSFPLH